MERLSSRATLRDARRDAESESAPDSGRCRDHGALRDAVERTRGDAGSALSHGDGAAGGGGTAVGRKAERRRLTNGAGAETRRCRTARLPEDATAEARTGQRRRETQSRTAQQLLRRSAFL